MSLEKLEKLQEEETKTLESDTAYFTHLKLKPFSQQKKCDIQYCNSNAIYTDNTYCVCGWHGNARLFSTILILNIKDN